MALTDGRRAGLASLLVGLAIVGFAQMTAPAASPPLYDGVFPVDAYRWLNPPPGEHGDAKGATATDRVSGGRSPLLAIGTPEQPPQAQIFGAPGGLILQSGTTAILLSITPIPSEGTPSDGHIAGNVYRISVTDQAGNSLTAPASAFISVVLRGPGNLAQATVERFVGGAWQPLKTTPSGIGSTFIAVVTEFGDFALVAPGPAPSLASPAAGSSMSASPEDSIVAPSPTPEPSAAPSPATTGDRTPLIIGLALGAGTLAGLGVWLLTRPRGARRR